MDKKYCLGLYEKAMPGNLTMAEKLTAAREAGYDYLEMSVDETDEKLARLNMSREERKELTLLMEKTGMPIRSMCLSGHRRYSLGSAEGAEQSLRIMEKAIELADDLGIRIIQLAGFHRHDDVQRMLHNCTENSDRNILICCSRDDVWLVVETGIRLSGRCHRDGIICIGRELYMYIQSFFRIVSFFDGSVDKGMHRIRIPVKDNAEIFKVTVGCCAFSSF